ncbi:hypothetical protein Acr_13g0014920 [Actinidia rufa]|uniref:Uncharacterized protein n=1 Tax=Actinidia rufa TaxID=165716 RepID=A0A7J0FMZ2_9ERIC|nr:hypothetical protein Acr_13g0014920 [Actinidia rufa]
MGNCQAVDAAALVIQHPSGSLATRLFFGRAYRLVTTQEVMKVLRAKKYAKMKKNQSDSGDKSRIDQERKSSNCEEETEKPELEKKSPVRTLQLVNDYPYEAMRHERQMPRAWIDKLCCS